MTRKNSVFSPEYFYLWSIESGDKKPIVLYLWSFFFTQYLVLLLILHTNEPYNLPNSSNDLHYLTRGWASKVSPHSTITEEKPLSILHSDWTTEHGMIPIKANSEQTKDSVWLRVNHALQRYKTSKTLLKERDQNPSQRSDLDVGKIPSNSVSLRWGSSVCTDDIGRR